MTSDLPNGVDSKLVFLVRKLLNVSCDSGKESERQSYVSSSSSIVNTLRSQHREYKRRDARLFASHVDAAILHINAQNQHSSGNDNGTHNVKRIQQNEFDGATVPKIGTFRETTEKSDGGRLNASLCSRYRMLQEERDKQSNELDKDTVSFDNVQSTNMPLSNNSNGKSDNILSPMPKTVTNSEDMSQSLDRSHANSTKSSTIKRRKIRHTTAHSPIPNTHRDQGAIDSCLVPVPRPHERYSDLGGMNDVIKQIRQLVEYPLVRPELYLHLGVDPPRGVLLRGPPGTGKTHLANAVAGQLGVSFFRVSAPELVSGVSGDSEGRIRQLFQAASDSAPSLIFMDELDVIAQKRGGDSRGMEKRMVAQLLTSMDKVTPANNLNGNAVVIIAATNRPDAMDPALRRAGRFDKEILLGVPDEEAREKIISTVTSKMRLSGNFDCKLLARKTPGYVGADIKSLAKEAAVIAIDRIFRNVLTDHQQIQNAEHSTGPMSNFDSNQSDGNNLLSDDFVNPCKSLDATSIKPLTKQQMDPLYVTMEDFLTAIPLVQPSAKREGFATVPDVTWDDIGALQQIREELKMSVLEPICHPERFHQLGLPLPAGVMLYGPPGCGKTLLAKAVAHESGANFISVKGPELLDKYVGESERSVRLVFERARSSSPCIIFFDELDSLVPRRGSGSDGSGGVSERVVNQLLTEMDGLESRRSVFVVAATNRPELIDPAMLRPGRLDKLLYVPLPTPEERVNIMRALAKKIRLHDDVDLDIIAQSPRSNGYSGADCAALLREAGLAVLKEVSNRLGTNWSTSEPTLCISARHFEAAFRAVIPSVSKQDQARYERIRDRMASARSRGDAHSESGETETSSAKDVVKNN